MKKTYIQPVSKAINLDLKGVLLADSYNYDTPGNGGKGEEDEDADARLHPEWNAWDNW